MLVSCSLHPFLDEIKMILCVDIFNSFRRRSSAFDFYFFAAINEI